MLRRSLLIISLTLLGFMLTACGGGGGSRGSTELKDDYRLGSLSVTQGSFDQTFDPNDRGPYRLDLENSVNTLTVNVGNALGKDVRIVSYRQVNLSRSVRNGRDQEQRVAPSTAVSFSLIEGDNIIAVRVQSPDGKQFLEYLIAVHRVSAQARLAGIGLNDFLGSRAKTRLKLVSPERFSSDVFTYEITVPFRVCSIGVTPVAGDRYSTISKNGDSVPNAALRLQTLNVGVNQMVIAVTSEDASSTTTYTFNITRAEPSEDDTDNNLFLSDLSFNTGDLQAATGDFSGFSCVVTGYDLRVNNDQATIEVSATPVISSRQPRIARIGRNAENTRDVVGDYTDIPAGASLPLEINVGNDNRYVISLSNDSNGNPLAQYAFRVTRSETNWVEVNTGEELQAALQNAQPNQEIIIRESTLSGSTELIDSGIDGVAFFSAASGTEEQPIILRGSDRVTLSANTEGEHTVMRLDGSYWRVSNLQIRGGAKGLVLDSATNNLFDTIFMRDFSERAIELRNGSNSNGFARVFIANVTGTSGAEGHRGEGIVVGSDASLWADAPTPGPYAAANDGNSFGNVAIGPNVVGELVRLNEGATNTSLLNVALDNRGSAAASMLLIKANDTSVSYSSFKSVSGNPPSAVIRVASPEADWLTAPWGENTTVFDNGFNLAGADVPLVASEGDVDLVSVDDNVRNDNGVVRYSGTAIMETRESPVFQIQSVFNNNCLAATDVGRTEGNPVTTALVVPCASDVSQQWDLVYDADGGVLLRSQRDGRKLAPFNLGGFVGARSSLLGFFADGDTFGDEQVIDERSSFFRWSINSGPRGEVFFSNRFFDAYVISVIDLPDTYVTDYPAASVAPNIGAQRQLFRLVPVAP